MPARGTALLSEVEAKLEQFLELDYDTPFKERVQSWLNDQVRPALSEMREGDEGEGAPEESAEPVEGEPSDEPAQPPPEPPKTFAGATRAAMEADQPKTPEEEEQADKPKKKAKAGSY